MECEPDFGDMQLPSTLTCCEINQDQSDAPSKSCGVQAHPYVRSKAIQYTLSFEMDRHTEVSMNTAVCRELSNDIIPTTSSDSTFSSPVKSSDEYIPSSETSEKDWDEESKPLVQEVQKMSLSVTLSLIEAKPRRYLGIPKDSFYVIDIIYIDDIYYIYCDTAFRCRSLESVFWEMTVSTSVICLPPPSILVLVSPKRQCCELYSERYTDNY